MNKAFIYGFLFLIIALGARALTTLEYEVDLQQYNLAPKNDIHSYEQFVHDIDSTSQESTIIIVENSNYWTTINDFKILDQISSYWSTRPEVENSFSILDLKYPKKRLIRPALTPFLDLNNVNRFEERMLNASAYPDIFEKFISSDFRYTLLFLETDGLITSSSKNLYNNQFPTYDHIKIHYIQSEAIESDLEERLNKDTYVLGILSLLLILGGFYFFTHSLKGILLITLMVAFNIAVTFLFIGLLDISLTMHMVTIPCIITILSFTDIMHILHYQNVYKNKSDNDNHLQNQITNKLRLPLILTSLTNIVGFLIFFVLSDNQFLMDYAITATIGVLTAYLSSRFIVIRLMQKASSYIQRDNFDSITSTHEYLSKWILGYPRRFVLLIVGVSLIITAYVLANFEIDTGDKDFIVTDSGSDILQQSFFGSHQAEVFIKIKNDSIWNKQYINQIDALENRINQIFQPLYINSPGTLIKRYNRYAHNGRIDAFRLPDEMGRLFVRDLVKTKQDLGGQGIVNENHTRARIVFGYNNESLSKTRSQYAELRKSLEQYNSETIHYDLSGLQVLSNEATYAFGIKLIMGFIGSIVFGCFIIMGLVRSLSKGLLFAFVNLFPIFLAIGILILSDISITPLTLFLLSILLGVCLDDSIYLIMQKEKDPKFNNLLPIFITSMVLSIGFISFSISGFQWIRPFGWVFPIGILIAYVLDFVLIKVWNFEK